MTQLADLIAERDRLSAEIANQRPAAIAEVLSLLAKLGLTVNDLPGRGALPVRRAAAVKYRDMAGNTWSGRGFKPTWLRQAIDSGRSLEDFAVPA